MRDTARGVLGGVCAGLSNRLGVEAGLVRAAVVVVTVLSGGLGAVAYSLAWGLLPAAPRPEEASSSRRRARRGVWRLSLGVGLLSLAVLLAFRELGIWWSDALVWPLVIAVAGAALIWRQLTASRPGEEPAAPVAATPEGPPRSGKGPRAYYRGGFGVALVVGAAILFLYANGALGPIRDAALAALVALVGLGLILAPFWVRLARNLGDERSARIRSQERAEVAAHLHDSVLQTLALVQKRAGDPREVSALARRQERELRSWLTGGGNGRTGGMREALEATAADVEELHRVPVEAVIVGDAELDERGEALLAAVREALANAARFAGEAGPVSLYAELGGDRLQAFVRDRGDGFDLATVPADRHGVRESIVGRMERHGGRAAIRGAAGAGTEVELTVERRAR